MRLSIWKSEGGFATLVAIIMVGMLTLIGLAALSTSDDEVTIAGNGLQEMRAFYAAEAGLEKAAAEFAGKELVPNREENDKYPFGPFFYSVLDKAYELDFFHIVLPEEADGMGHGMRALCTILDCICQADSSLGGIIFTSTAAQELLLTAGENEK